MQTTETTKSSRKANEKAGESRNEDLEAGATMANLTPHNLQDIYEDILEKFEENAVTDRPQFIDDYVATMVKRDEMTSLWTDPAFYRKLKLAIQQELLPIYDHYRARRAKVEQKLEKATWSRYCLWTIGICLGIELLITEGRVLRPQLLMPAVLVDGLLGWGIWYIANYRALAELRRINRSLAHGVGDLVAKQQVSDQYEVFRSFTGGDLLKAELQQLLANYATPAEFWRDYYKVRQADPTTETALDALGIARFKGFLELHVGGAYSTEGRQQRFDALFLLAHKAFLLADRKNYVLQNLAPEQKATL